MRPEWQIDWLGLLVAGGLGALIRYLNLPIPAPPAISGALMVVAVTIGYLAVDYFLKG
jgi:XapX domain-containing protein